MKFNFLILLLLFCFSFYLSSCSSLKSWTQANKSDRSFQVSNVWTTSLTKSDNLGFRKINRFTPLLYKSSKLGDIFVQANAIDGITAYSLNDHQKIWHLNVINGVEGSATIISNYLFFGASDGQFYNVDAENGNVLWSFPTRTENLSEPIVSNGIVYFLTGSNSLYALEADSGKQAWVYSRPDSSTISVRGGSRPALKKDTVFVGFSDGALVALNAKTGQIKWEKQLNKNKKFRDLDTDPLIDDEYIYVLGFDDAAYALRSATGDVAWRIEKGGYGGFLMNGDRLYYASSNEELVCADKTTGRVIWTKKSLNGIPTTPSLISGILVYGESQGQLKFVEASSGKEIANFEPGRGILSRPTVDDKRRTVYFVSGEANLYGIEAKWIKNSQKTYLR